MVDYRIVASDLDGTLLNSSDLVSEENWAAIAEMKARGVHFVPCTGRTLNEMDPLIRDNSNVRYLIQSDGAVVYDKETDRRITACMGARRRNLSLIRFLLTTCTRLCDMKDIHISMRERAILRGMRITTSTRLIGIAFASDLLSSKRILRRSVRAWSKWR